MRQREPDKREYAHDALGDRFETALSSYDTRRRVEVLIDGFLPDEAIVGKRLLDVGSGLGFFSERAAERGAIVTAVDLGPGLVERTRARASCRAEVADALALEEHFGDERFDVVISSECIEHTPDPARAIEQMAAVLEPGGLLSLSTPNTLWWPVVAAATKVGLRPFDGLENFSTFRSIRRTLESSGMEILEERGLHLFPFQIGLHRLSTYCDEHLQELRFLMINLCVLARKLP